MDFSNARAQPVFAHATLNVMKALVLSGGGARGAYQVGVLKAVGELAKENQLENPFEILCGVSAGAINASFLASTCHEFQRSTQNLVDLWASLTSDQVFRTDALSVGKIGLKLIQELSFGGMTKVQSQTALLDTEPLSHLIQNNLNLPQIEENLRTQKLKALAITALEYQTSETITFLQGGDELPSWVKPRRRSLKSKIRTEHVLASSAIPLLFPPTEVDGRYFGDGCVRNMAPLSPALYLGAKDLLIIGVRLAQEISSTQTANPARSPSIARIANVILNSVLLDGIEIDVERLQRINEFLRRVPKQHQGNLNFRPVNALFISPSEDIGKIAFEMSSRLPRVIRYLLKGLGPLNEASEIMSYLLFEKDFTLRLIEMGYKDGMAKKAELLRFLLESRPQSLDWEGF
jgi:NTE family protein